MVTFALLVLVLGVIAFAVGVRGRRVGAEPRCRRCDFDLTGLAGGGAPACPECGARLADPRSIVNGSRRRSTAPIAIGVALFAAAGLGAVVAVRQINIVPYLPSRVLAMYTRWTDDPGVLDELRARLDAGGLGAASVDAVVAAALMAQADRSRPWDTRWGGFVESASLRKQLDPVEERRYLDQMFAVSGVKTRSMTMPGWRVPVQVQFDVRRGGLRGVGVKPRVLGEIKGFEMPRPEHLWGGFGLGVYPDLRVAELIGYGQAGEPRPDQPKAPPGEHTFAMEATWWVYWEGDEPPSKDLKESVLPAPSGRWSERRPIKVAASIDDILPPAARTPGERGAIELRASLPSVLQRFEAGKPWVNRKTRDGRWEQVKEGFPADVMLSLSVDPGTGSGGDGPEVNVDVFVVADGREQWLARTTVQGTAPGGHAQGIVSIRESETTVKLIVRPSPEATLTTVDGAPAAAVDETVFEGLPLIQGYPRSGVTWIRATAAAPTSVR